MIVCDICKKREAPSFKDRFSIPTFQSYIVQIPMENALCDNTWYTNTLFKHNKIDRGEVVLCKDCQIKIATYVHRLVLEGEHK